MATRRSLRTLFFPSTCSPSMTPMSRDGTNTPGNAGSSINSSTSIGSPSSAIVFGRNPKSWGNTMPAGNTFFREKISCSSSKENLFRLPFGVSTITCSNPSFLRTGSNRVGSTRLFKLFFAIGAPLLTDCYSLRADTLLSSCTINLARFEYPRYPAPTMKEKISPALLPLFLFLTACDPHPQPTPEPAPRPRATALAEQPPVTQNFDYYLLNLSWSPEFCHSHP